MRGLTATSFPSPFYFCGTWNRHGESGRNPRISTRVVCSLSDMLPVCCPRQAAVLLSDRLSTYANIERAAFCRTADSELSESKRFRFYAQSARTLRDNLLLFWENINVSLKYVCRPVDVGNVYIARWFHYVCNNPSGVQKLSHLLYFEVGIR